MSKLDIQTERGQMAAADQQVAIRAILAGHGQAITFAHTPLNSGAAADGFFIKDGVLLAVAEVKTRYDCDEDKFFCEYKGLWLLSQSKLTDMAMLCQMLWVPAYGVLYLPQSRLVLVRKLLDKNGAVTGEFYYAKTETRATINGGVALRDNVFIDMHQAKRFIVPSVLVDAEHENSAHSV